MDTCGGGRLVSGFSHLHMRSGFSYGYGVAHPDELATAATGRGMGSSAITDRDGLYGVPRFLMACEEKDLSPIIGAEITVEDGGHVVLLAESMAGYRSLSKLITAYRCGSENRRQPLCSLDLLLDHAEGLICLTGAIPQGLLSHLLLERGQQEAERVAGSLLEAFGPDGLYVELTDDRTSGSRRRLKRVAAFARERSLPTVATNEVAYLRPEDHRLHEVLVAASNRSPLPGPGYRPTDQLYLKPPERMAKLFRDYPNALRNAVALSERCAGAVRLSGEVHMPGVRLPNGETPEKKLYRLALAGAKRRYGKSLDRRVWSRLTREISCINSLGFAPYFLIAHEAVDIAHKKGVPVTGRGSAANSMVSYCLGLTRPEPLSNRLLFERFLHEYRKDPPDIDLDLDSERRDEVRDELIHRYEHLGVAVAATAQTFSLRGAVRVAARALGHSPQEINRLSRHVPTRFSDRDRLLNPISGWNEALEEPAMREHPLQDRKRYSLLLDLSWRLSGRLSKAGTHNGGLLFGNHAPRLSELVPLEPSGKKGLLRGQYDKDDLEYIGLPKLDLLGLKMHTALRKAGELVSKNLGREIDPLSPPPKDKETYRLIRSGRNVGMFQLESPGQMHLSTRLKPRRFSDLTAQISLFRPGPVRGDLVTPYVLRRNGLEPYSVPLSELEEILKPTYGVLIFQEQVLEVANAVAEFSLVEGDLIRRAMTKSRGPGAMRNLRDKFVVRAAGRGVPKAKAREVFDWMEGFSVYGFSAAHAASFAHLSYASAYMRCHHPAEFFSGILNSMPMGFFSPRIVLNEARRIGLKILPPDIHLSEEGFAVVEQGNALRAGYRYCKGLSEKAISSILSERTKKPFSTVADIYQRTAVEKDSLQNLIKGGFLDGLPEYDEDRTRLLEETRNLPRKRKRNDRQPEIPLTHPASWWASREGRSVEYLTLTQTTAERMEWEVLDLNLRRHPLFPYHGALEELGVTPSKDIRDLPSGTRTRAAGLMECLQCPPTKSGVPVYFLLIEDEAGLLQATIFERVYERYGHILHRSGAFLLEGRVEQDRRRGFSFLVDRIEDLAEVLSETRIPSPRTSSASGAFIRAGRGSRRRRAG